MRIGPSSTRMRLNGIISQILRTAILVLCLAVGAEAQNQNVRITTDKLPDAVVGSMYSFTLTAAGGMQPYVWSASGLPAGLSLDSRTGIISGIPVSAEKKHDIAVRVQAGGSSNDKNLSLAINAAPLSITTSSPLPAGTVGTPYPSQTLTATGGVPPYSWSLAGGSLPSGLNLSSAGVISGTATVAGTFNFTIRLRDNDDHNATKALALTINPAAAMPLSITTESLPMGTVGTAYSHTLVATGGTAPYRWSVAMGSSVPAGLTLSASGVLSGTPTVAGTSNVTIQLGDSRGATATKVFALTINAAPAPVPPPLSIITESPLPTGQVSTPYSQTFNASGGTSPYSWSVVTGSSLPAALTISNGGTLSGTPGSPGTFNFTVQVSDAAGQAATKAFTMTISAAALTITTSAFPIATLNTAYSAQLEATGGTPPYTWSVVTGTLPPGLTLTAAGTVTGTPSNVGSQDFVIRVTDSTTASTTRSFTLLVQAVGGGSFPTISANVPATGTPTQQLAFSLFLSAPFPSAIPIQLNLAFSSNAAIPADDPMTQFSNGSRTVNFTIPANTTSFPVPASLLLGTVSGTVRLTGNSQGGPAAIPVGSLTIPPSGPQITNVNVARPNGGLELQITGYSPMRRVVSVEFGFGLRTQSGTQQFTLRRSVESDFTNWYRDPASTPFGSAFSYRQSFTVQSNVSVDSVTVTLINEQGGTPSSSVPATN
jgi:hypothetical protein